MKIKNKSNRKCRWTKYVYVLENSTKDMNVVWAEDENLFKNAIVDE